MGSRFIYPSPRGVHVAETYASDDQDPYRPPRQNRYSRSVHQTPRTRDVTWISPSEPTPQTPHGPPTPWLPPPQVPSSPAYRPPSPIPPSPAPTVGEHMAVDDLIFTQDDLVDPYRPQRRPSGGGLLRSLWNGLKKLSGYQPPSYLQRPSWYGSQTAEMPAPIFSAASEATQYVDQTPTTSEEQQGATPYASPYARPVHLGGPGSQHASPVPSMKIPQPTSARGSPMPVPSVDISPYARPVNLGATSAIFPGSRRASPTPVSSIDIAPAITVVSPSIPPSPRPSLMRSARAPSPAMGLGVPRYPSVGGGSDLGAVPAPPVVEEGFQTLREPGRVLPPLDTQIRPSGGPILRTAHGAKAVAFDEPASPEGSLASTVARFRRFAAGLDALPWTTGAQIADEYVPAENPRSQMRRRVRQGAEPSWYNPRAEVVERPAYLSEWDMWAMQSAAVLWDGKGGGGGGVVYPHGYVGLAHPPPGHAHSPVVP